MLILIICVEVEVEVILKYVIVIEKYITGKYLFYYSVGTTVVVYHNNFKNSLAT